MIHKRPPFTGILILSVILCGCLCFPPFIFGHGAPGDTIAHDIKIHCDSQYVEITSDMDLPIAIALDLRNQLDTDGNYRISPEEQKKLLPLLYREGTPIRLKIEGKEITLAPLYTPQLKLSRYTNLESRGSLKITWFGYAPKTIKKGAAVEFSHQLWPDALIATTVNFKGEDGLKFAIKGTDEKLFHPHEKRAFNFTTLSGTNTKGAPSQVKPSQKIEQTERMVPENAVLFAEALTLHYAYLLPEEQQQQVKMLHRRLRMENQIFQAARDSKARAAALKKLDHTSAAFIALLKKCQSTVHIDLNEKNSLQEPVNAIELPGDAGALLLCIKRGDGIHQGRIYDHSFSIREFIEPMDTGILAEGTTWLLVRLKKVPQDPTRLKFALRTGDGTANILPVRVKSPPPARLKVTILSDDTGEPTPAMVSLRWKTCNFDRRPSTALDIVPQFNGQGRLTNFRHTNTPGKYNVDFWIVTKPFEMNLPPGKWEIVVQHGAEHSVVFDAFTLKPGERSEKTYRPKRWVNMPKKGWYSGDDHVHCQILSDQDAQNLMDYVVAEDIHLANVVKMGDIHRTFFQQRGFGKGYRVRKGHYVLSPGQEDPRTHQQLGHTLAMNTRAFVRDTNKYYLYDLVFDEVHRQGGLSGHAHVNRDLFFVHRDMSLNIPRHKVDFAEILQFGKLGTDLYYEFLNLGYPLTASAGSDIPWGGTLGEVRVFAYLGEKTFSADNWFEAFRQGHTFVSNGPMLELEVEGARPGDHMELDKDRPVRVRGRLMIDPDRGAGSLDLIAHGEVINSVKASHDGQREIVMDVSVPVKGGVWLALKGTGANGSVAHTTPVYITRKGQRFWKRNEVESLIEKQLKRLGEIELIVSNARIAVGLGLSPALTEIHELAKEGDQLMERVRLAKGLYAELLKKFRQEKKSPSSDNSAGS